MAETLKREEPPPDLTDFMNDMFFGTADTHQKTYDLTGGVGMNMDDDEEDDGFDDSTRSNSARLTQEWLQEARLVVASSPSRCESPGRLLGSPRFASPSKSLLPSSDRTEALSRARSARSNSNNNNNTQPPSPDSLPPRQPLSRKSRFQTEPSGATHPQGIQVPNYNSRRTFKPSAPSPENPNRRIPPTSLESLPLSPPRNLVESAHRRTISSSTCSWEKIVPPVKYSTKEEEEATEEYSLNGFLKEQRNLFQRFYKGELSSNVKIKIVLSGHSNSTTSMVAAICHAWLLGYRQKENDEGGNERTVVVPVMNVKRGDMCKLKQAAWLFHHAGLDATSLLFTDEVDMESLLMTGKLSVLMVGQDILNATNEVGSQCTVLTDNYCEDAYDLLQNSVLKKLLLAGILLDTQNLKASASVSMTRDAEAVQLLLVGSAPNYRYTLFDQLMQDQQSSSFVEALNHNYWKPPDESKTPEDTQPFKSLRFGKLSFTALHSKSKSPLANKSHFLDEIHLCETFQCRTPSNAPPFESWNPGNHSLHDTLSADTSLGDKNNEGNMKHKVRERKSSSSERQATTTKPSSKSNSIDTKVKLATPILQSPSPAASSNAEKESSSGKNKFFLARWFGFGSK
ncbi:hypothetical protein L195_g009544 [Trifolium pratense]|uniref:Uncharacterized protein n=1 Tax=Trifolium pratense TaxID=57577 RepID=A0A2K3PC84_TRIPR|nr:hypothetical protein L195_g009544 [Trifolium pratense]